VFGGVGPKKFRHSRPASTTITVSGLHQAQPEVEHQSSVERELNELHQQRDCWRNDPIKLATLADWRIKDSSQQLREAAVGG